MSKIRRSPAAREKAAERWADLQAARIAKEAAEKRAAYYEKIYGEEVKIYE